MSNEETEATVEINDGKVCGIQSAIKAHQNERQFEMKYNRLLIKQRTKNVVIKNIFRLVLYLHFIFIYPKIRKKMYQLNKK